MKLDNFQQCFSFLLKGEKAMACPASVLVLDCETTGFRPPHVITEFAAVAVDTGTLETIAEFERRVCITPEQIAGMTSSAREVNGWTPEINATGIVMGQARQDFLDWCKSFDILGYVAHNADFDRNHFVAEGIVKGASKWLCTIAGMKNLMHMGVKHFERFRLEKLAEACAYTQPEKHRALADARTCAAGFVWLVKNGASLQHMVIHDSNSLPF